MSVATPEGDSEPHKTWLNLKQIADYYQIKIDTLNNWLRSGKLGPHNGAYKVGHQWRINRREFESKFIGRTGTE